MDRDLEDDMRNSRWFMEKIQNDSYAQNIYAALCNMRWQPRDVLTILKDEYWSCSWRSAGGLVAELQGKGDYMDWYCSGMGGLGSYNPDNEDNVFKTKGYVPEATVTDEVRADLLRLGWQPSEWPDD